MPTTTQILNAATQFIVASDKAHEIINGSDTATVETEAGNLDTMAKALKDFREKSVRFDVNQTSLGGALKAQARANISAQEASDNLTEYAENPQDAIFANMPPSVVLTSVPRVLYTVSGAGTSSVNGTYSQFFKTALGVEYRKYPFVSEFPKIYHDFSASEAFIRTTGDVDRYQAMSVELLEDATWFTGGPLSGATPVPTIDLAGVSPSFLGQGVTVFHSDGSQTEWGATSRTEWKPRTAGILLDRISQVWVRLYLEGSTIQQEILANQ